ncbi:MAG: hypothetical protein ABSH32_31695 [Bryobacteraceae bacterium]|jgi:hypothetical protein
MANTATSNPRSGKLNIVVHGTVGFFLDGKSVRVVIPTVENFNIVAGTFLKEQPLAKGKTYSLVGVKGAAAGETPSISTGVNIFLVGVEVNEAARFCEFDLLVPAGFRSVRTMKVRSKWYKPPLPPKFIKPKQLALVHVLTYDFEDYESLKILPEDGEIKWKPEFNDQTKTVNLQIYCDPKSDTAPAPDPPFKNLMNLFGMTTVELDTTAIGRFKAPRNPYPEIKGLENPLELEDYIAGHTAAAAIQPPNDCAPVHGLAEKHPATHGWRTARTATPAGTTTPFPFCINIRDTADVETAPSGGPNPSSAGPVSEAAKPG